MISDRAQLLTRSLFTFNHQAAQLREEIDTLSKPSSVQRPASPMKKAATPSGRLHVDVTHFESWPEVSNEPIGRLMTRGNSQTNSPSRSPSIRSASPTRSPSRRLNPEAVQSYEKRLLALEAELAESRVAMDEMQGDLRRRKESYMRREEVLTREVEALQEELRILRGERVEAPVKGKSKDTIKVLHGQITSELENLLLKQEVALNYNSNVTIRTYADKLNAYEEQIARDKDLKGNSLAQWMERTAALRAENDNTREIAMAIDAKYKEKDEECTRLRNEYKAQEDDRAILLSQMVKLRNENKKLSMELVTQSQELEEIKEERDNLLRVQNELFMSREYHSSSERESIVSKDAQKAAALKQLLEAERKRVREAQSELELQSKKQSDLFLFLQSCLDDCREKQILGSREKAVRSSNRPSSAMTSTRRPYSAVPTSRPFSAMNSESRDSFADELVRRESLLVHILSSLGSKGDASGVKAERRDVNRPISATVRPPLPPQFLRPHSAIAATSPAAPSNAAKAAPRDDDDFIIDEGDEEELCVPNPSVHLVGSKPWIFDASAIHRDHLSSGGGSKQPAKPRSAGRLGSWGRPVSAVGKS